MDKPSNEKLFQNIGVGVASLTFGVALSIFIFATASGKINGISAWLLFLASFLLMLRFWWRYVELFVSSLPSQTFWQFFFDFAISFFGVAAVLFVADLQLWTILIGAVMLSSAVRCGLSWRMAKDEVVHSKLKRTLFGAIGMLVLMAIAYSAAFVGVSHTVLAAIILAVFAFFVFYAVKRP